MRRSSPERRPNTTWRVFCAVELPSSLHQRIHQHISTLKALLPAARASWSRPENTHLTLKFFGNVDQSRIPNISAATARAVEDLAPFQIVIGGTGAFPDVNRARVLWIAVDDPDRKLKQLHSKLDDECAKEDFSKEEREFHPHLTIARIRQPDGARILAETHRDKKFADVVIEVRELIVFRSELSSKGSKYTALSHHPLMSDKLY